MVQAKGSSAQLIGGIKEATYNTTPGTHAGIVLPVMSATIRGSQNMQTTAVIRGTRNPAQPFFGNVDVQGQVVVPIDEVGIGYWLQMLLGDPATSGTGPYTHVFTVPTAIDSWCLEQGYTDIGVYQLFNGCKAQSLSFTAGGDGELSATVQIVGGKETISGTSVDATPTTITLSQFNNFQGSVFEGGSVSSIVQEVEMTISNELDTSVFVIGGGGIRGALPEGVVKISGRVKALFDSPTLYNKAVNRTESSLKLKFTSGTHSLEFSVEELFYQRNAPGIETPGGIYVDMPFEGFYTNGASASGIKVTLVNGKTAYL